MTIAFVISPSYLGKATDQLALIVQNNYSDNIYLEIDKFLMIALILYITSNIFLYLQNLAGTILSQKICYYLREQLALKISKLPYSYFEAHQTGDIISRFTNDVDLIGQNFSSVLISIISAIMTLLGIFIGMIALNVYVAIVLCAISLVVFIVMIIVVKISQKYYISQQEKLGEIDGFINESYASQEIILTYNAEKTFNQKFNKINERLYKDGFISSFLSRIIFTVNNFFYLISFSVIILLGTKLISNNILSIGDLQTFLIYSYLISIPLSEISTVINLGQQIIAAGKRVFDFLDEKEIDPSNYSINKSSINKYDIKIKNVSFSYSDKEILKSITFNIKENSKIAIVGHTGSGKTTLSKLLLGFYDDYKGSIKIDNSELKNIYKNDLRDIVGIVPQDVSLQTGTIAQNISFELDNIDYNKVKWAAKMACADEFINDLQDSYNYVIEDNLKSFSLGQLQMINIARAFYSDKKIIIFDEATSYVDTYTESLVQQAIDNLAKHKTVIIIAHRLKTIKKCDSIIVLRDGSIVEQGKHEELLNNNGEYSKMHNSQN